MLVSDPWLFSISMIVTGAVLFLLVYFNKNKHFVLSQAQELAVALLTLFHNNNNIFQDLKNSQDTEYEKGLFVSHMRNKYLVYVNATVVNVSMVGFWASINFKVITLSDLECDYLNSQQCCSVLNMGVIPKLVAHIIICFLFLIHGHWILFLINLPLAGWLIFEYTQVPKGNVGVYDPTEIHNRGQLKKHMRDCLIHLGMYLILFFIYLYCLIISILKDNPLEKSSPVEDSDF